MSNSDSLLDQRIKKLEDCNDAFIANLKANSVSSLDQRVNVLENYKVVAFATSSALTLIITVLGLFAYTNIFDLKKELSNLEEKVSDARLRAEEAHSKADEVTKELEKKKDEIISDFTKDFKVLAGKEVQNITAEAGLLKEKIRTSYNNYEENIASIVMNKFVRKLKTEPLIVGKLIVADKHNEGVIVGVNSNSDGIIMINSRRKKGKVMLYVKNEEGMVDALDSNNFTHPLYRDKKSK